MLNNRFSFWFALSVTCFGLVSGNGYCLAAVFEENSYSLKLAQVESDLHNKKASVTAQNLQYEEYMAAGYEADKNRDYLAALVHFQKALVIRPQDSFAERAIINITSYAFDRYMQAGYTADRNQNYQVALVNFEKAQQIKPDSVYALTAIGNMKQYLAANAQSTQKPSTNGRNLLLMIAGLIITALVGAGVLFLLLKKGTTPPQESTEENLTSNTPPQNTVVEIPAAQSQVNPKVESSPIIASTNGNLNQVESSSAMLVSPSSSISKLDIVPELIEDLNTSDRSIRRKTIWELAQRADSRAMKPLVELMINVDSQERSLILEAMTQIASRTLKPMNQALMLSLEDENSQVRQNAIRDLTRVYDLMSQVTKRLSQAVEDSDAQVQETAKWALQQLNQMPQVPWEMTAMQDNKDSTNRM
ncbi:Tetratricopeptide TPR_1 repeat-containing protein [Stanieria cyanosphaera PCC 7437]|uniref:Tetratricopeptide TPR_1 repeat-containing protein n=1 Tax=Stanieria cyanosphaera (strain ATCC 29371 / PCC 7437) TaxID=111780 RepID=K9XTR1_STAC7|nr:Tetratricopeptide TPR_1 repeat-containing protein [Stanieria cyanosphaera]AFZ35052.1 Tetratricopeptide TPR_1 repeat-containing protein [Stanieria cyanosphaera PCC 7437]